MTPNQKIPWAIREITDKMRAAVRARLPRLPDSWKPIPSTMYTAEGTRTNEVTRDVIAPPRIVEPSKPFNARDRKRSVSRLTDENAA